MAWHEKAYAVPIVLIVAEVVDDVDDAALVHLRKVVRYRKVCEQEGKDEFPPCGGGDAGRVVESTCSENDQHG